VPGLLANENVPLPAVKLLRRKGFDVVATAETMPGASDEQVLRFSRDERRWLVTYDRDYGELVFSRGLPSPPAIVYLSSPGATASRDLCPLIPAFLKSLTVLLPRTLVQIGGTTADAYPARAPGSKTHLSAVPAKRDRSPRRHCAGAARSRILLVQLRRIGSVGCVSQLSLSMAACAAASRAIGTRNGEQLT
jgi:predicted nuclease of predicted toxin-antitoxin system